MASKRTVGVACLLLGLVGGWVLLGLLDPTSAPTPQSADGVRQAEASAKPAIRARSRSDPRRDDDSAPKTASEPPAPAGKPTAGDAVETRKETASPAAEPLREIEGFVVDVASHEPVTGVRIHLHATLDGEDLGWEGAESGGDGRFQCHVLPEWPADKCRLEIRAGRDGYRAARVPVTTGKVRIELERQSAATRPGRITGIALGEDGKPLTGRLFLGLNDDLDLHSFGAWTRADELGRFTLEGIPPGHWSVALSESRSRVEVNVPDGGDAMVELRTDFRDGATGAFAKGALTESTYLREKERLDGVLAAGLRAAPDGKSADDDPVVRVAIYAVQQLEYRWLRVAPGRDVAATVLSAPSGSFVRLDHAEGAGCEFRAAGVRGRARIEWVGGYPGVGAGGEDRAAVIDGRARFESVPYGAWRAVLARAGAADASVEVDVKAGDGPVAVVIPAAK